MNTAESAVDLETGFESAANVRAIAVPSAPRVILVDAFNVLHAVLLGKDRRTRWWRREHRERLLEQIAAWQRGPDEIWVAFDGPRPAMSVWAEPIALPSEERPRGATVHCLFVESADDWIVRRARRAENPGRMVVVSADRKVAGRARSAGCEIWTPWEFMAGCSPPATDASESANPTNATDPPDPPDKPTDPALSRP